jgi:hypothetical protein
MSQKFDVHELLNTSSNLRSCRLPTKGITIFSCFNAEQVLYHISTLNATNCDAARLHPEVFEGRQGARRRAECNLGDVGRNTHDM